MGRAETVQVIATEEEAWVLYGAATLHGRQSCAEHMQMFDVPVPFGVVSPLDGGRWTTR